jgi:transcriptional regulator with XRE-family HTH domain
VAFTKAIERGFLTMDETTWFAQLGEQFAHDPEYITHGLLLEITAEICRAMEEQGISRSELAERMGVARQRVTNFLNTPSNTTLQTVVRFAEALGLCVEVAVKERYGDACLADPDVAPLADLDAFKRLIGEGYLVTDLEPAERGIALDENRAVA